MTTKAETLNKLIAAIPGVCSGGREGIRDLVAEITGEKLVEIPEETYRVGDRFIYDRSTTPGKHQDEYILAAAGDDLRPMTSRKVMCVNLRTGGRRRPPVEVRHTHKITAAELTALFETRYPERIKKVASGSGQF